MTHSATSAPLEHTVLPRQTEPQTVLHVGCGAADPAKLPAGYFPPDRWYEIRLDLDPAVRPDHVASITNMGVVADQSVDAVWSAHNLEHLFAHEVPLALREFHRVLRRGGFALVTMPDLQQVAELVVNGSLEDTAYMSTMGPVRPLDMIYGFAPAIAGGNAFMAHRTGFTAATLRACLERAGFHDVEVQRDGRFGLWAYAIRND
jgi:hypothetical protein